VSGYTVTYLGSHTVRSAQKSTIVADVRVTKGGRSLGTYSPGISTYPNSTEGIGTPSVHTGVVDDVYLTLLSARDAQNRVTLGVRINTLIVWLWVGGAFMALGTVLALAPRLRRRPRAEADDGAWPEPEPDPEPAPEPEDEPREEVPV
jgi:cytochrome c-type biogenesis protein CcmF